MRRTLHLVTLATPLLLAAGPALAGRISCLSVSPTTAQVNQPVTIHVGHAGSKCGYKYSTGVGAAQGPKLLTGTGASLSVTYPQAGVFSVTVWGRKKGSTPKCNVGAGVQPVTVTVQAAASPGGTMSPKPAGGRPPLKKVEPGSQSITKPPPIPLSDPRDRNPVINSVLFTMGPVGAVGPGILSPGGRIFVKGLGFGGNTGQLYLKVSRADFPEFADRVQLVDLKWGRSAVNGRIPTGI